MAADCVRWLSRGHALAPADSVRFSFVWLMAVVAACIHWHGTEFTSRNYVLPSQLAIMGLWLSCCLFRDAWALYLRRRLPAVWLGLVVLACWVWFQLSRNSCIAVG